MGVTRHHRIMLSIFMIVFGLVCVCGLGGGGGGAEFWVKEG